MSCSLRRQFGTPDHGRGDLEQVVTNVHFSHAEEWPQRFSTHVSRWSLSALARNSWRRLGMFGFVSLLMDISSGMIHAAARMSERLVG
jgi:hypothetical protein